MIRSRNPTEQGPVPVAQLRTIDGLKNFSCMTVEDLASFQNTCLPRLVPAVVYIRAADPPSTFEVAREPEISEDYYSNE